MDTTIKLLIAGDFCPNERVATIMESTERGIILSDIAPLVQSCDMAVVNLECPVAVHAAQPIVKEGPHLKCTPAALELLKDSGFSLVTLANNHILDYGPEGLEDTTSALDKAGLAHVGAGKNLQEAGSVYYRECKGQRVAVLNCCEHEFSIASEESAGANPLNPVRQWQALQEARQQADFVLVIVHGGHEHYPLPSPRMQETYRFFVDAGADAVINHHQHCASGYERYKGKPIFYGLGNFCFDWKGKQDSAWNYGYMVELQLGKTIDFALWHYEQCNQTPDVRLLEGRKKEQADEQIQQLNRIIASPKELADAHARWMDEDEREWLVAMLPFGRIIKALIRRRLLPLRLSKRTVVWMLNKTACESHRDKLLHILKKQIR
jgi:poly-gamma-glutamate synthesis protein (capsule biosynthesis protein)